MFDPKTTKKYLINIGFLIVGIGLAIGLGYVYAFEWNQAESTGNQLTADNWNALVEQIREGLASSAKPQFLGYAGPTSGAVSEGTSNGIAAMNRKCNNVYPGVQAHACTYDELLKIGYNFPTYPNGVWVIDGVEMVGEELISSDKYYMYELADGTQYDRNPSSGLSNCQGWRSSGTGRAAALGNSGLYFAGCASNLNIPCCK